MGEGGVGGEGGGKAQVEEVVVANEVVKSRPMFARAAFVAKDKDGVVVPPTLPSYSGPG